LRGAGVVEGGFVHRGLLAGGAGQECCQQQEREAGHVHAYSIVPGAGAGVIPAAGGAAHQFHGIRSLSHGAPSPMASTVVSQAVPAALVAVFQALEAVSTVASQAVEAASTLVSQAEAAASVVRSQATETAPVTVFQPSLAFSSA